MTIIGRKMIGSILLGAVVISSMPVNAADSRELVDITAPYIDLSTLEIDKQTVDAEETVTLKVKASDDLSGISYASVYYYGSNDQGSIALEYDAESGHLVRLYSHWRDNLLLLYSLEVPPLFLAHRN